MKAGLSGFVDGLLTLVSGLLHVLDVVREGRAGARAAESERLGRRARARARAERRRQNKPQ